MFIATGDTFQQTHTAYKTIDLLARETLNLWPQQSGPQPGGSMGGRQWQYENITSALEDQYIPAGCW